MSARRLACVIAVLGLWLIGGGCGATPAQAPRVQAARLDTALSAIATACGLADQIAAFPPSPAAQRASLEATARAQAAKLATVFHRNPNWIYQGETVRRIVADAIAMLGACGLPEARAALARQTGR